MTSKRRRATIYAIAEVAGVSISTVSLAINHPHRVSDATRKRIVEVAKALGYRPDNAPGTAGSQRQGGIAVAGPFSSYPTYSRRLIGILDRLRGTAIDITVHDLDSAAAAESPLLDALPIRAGVDGIIVMGVPMSTEGIDRISDWGPPIVHLDVPDRSAPGVVVDDHAGGFAIGRHLHELGHHHVLFVHEPQRSFDYVSAGMLRLAGLREGLQSVEPRSGDRTNSIDTLVANIGSDAGALVAAAISSSSNLATAIVASHDGLAAEVRLGLLSAGVRVPEDVSLVGYDDGPLARGLDLTTVRQPFEQSGRAAVDLLLGLMSGGSSEIARVELTADLIVRGTTTPPRR